MPTKVSVARALARKKYNSRCGVCGDGPLERRAMHLVSDWRINDGEAFPTCTKCRDMLANKNLKKAFQEELKMLLRRYDGLASFLHNAGVKDLAVMPPRGLYYGDPVDHYKE